jgi:hypothetical protein
MMADVIMYYKEMLMTLVDFWTILENTGQGGYAVPALKILCCENKV